MINRSIKWAAGVPLFAAMLAIGTSLPAGQGQAQQVTAVPRAGLAFSTAVTTRATIESVDPETRTAAFTLPDGRLIHVAVSDSVRNLDSIPDGANVNVTYNEIVTILNLRQKGPGSREARRETGSPPTATDIESGRFTLTVTAIDLAGNTISVIDGRGGPIRTYTATSAAQKEALKKAKIGDVVIGLTTPLTVTAITPVP
jgi:hypothetical protein